VRPGDREEGVETPPLRGGVIVYSMLMINVCLQFCHLGLSACSDSHAYAISTLIALSHFLSNRTHTTTRVRAKRAKCCKVPIMNARSVDDECSRSLKPRLSKIMIVDHEVLSTGQSLGLIFVFSELVNL